MFDRGGCASATPGSASRSIGLGAGRLEPVGCSVFAVRVHRTCFSDKESPDDAGWSLRTRTGSPGPHRAQGLSCGTHHTVVSGPRYAPIGQSCRTLRSLGLGSRARPTIPICSPGYITSTVQGLLLANRPIGPGLRPNEADRDRYVIRWARLGVRESLTMAVPTIPNSAAGGGRRPRSRPRAVGVPRLPGRLVRGAACRRDQPHPAPADARGRSSRARADRGSSCARIGDAGAHRRARLDTRTIPRATTRSSPPLDTNVRSCPVAGVAVSVSRPYVSPKHHSNLCADAFPKSRNPFRARPTIEADGVFFMPDEGRPASCCIGPLTAGRSVAADRSTIFGKLGFRLLAELSAKRSGRRVRNATGSFPRSSCDAWRRASSACRPDATRL